MFNINVAHQKLKESDKIGSVPHYPKTQKFWSGSAARARWADFGKGGSNTGSRIILNFKQLHIKNTSNIKPKGLNLCMFKRFTLFSLGKRITCSCCQGIRIPLEDSFLSLQSCTEAICSLNTEHKFKVPPRALRTCREQEKALQYKVQTNAWSCLCPARWFNIQLKL